tara:strand:+ start:238 stop:549 length:312 start_codon:yes stop_codon:yes gene_type:complete
MNAEKIKKNFDIALGELEDRVRALTIKDSKTTIQLAKQMLKIKQLFKSHGKKNFQFLNYCENNFGYKQASVYRLLRLAAKPILHNIELETAKYTGYQRRAMSF